MSSIEDKIEGASAYFCLHRNFSKIEQEKVAGLGYSCLGVLNPVPGVGPVCS